MQRRHDLKRFHDDFRTAQIASILGTVHGKNGQARSPLEFVTVPCGQGEEHQGMTDEQIAAVFMAMAGEPIKQN